MKTFIIQGFKNGIWGLFEIKTIPEMIEQRATEKGITITHIYN